MLICKKIQSFDRGTMVLNKQYWDNWISTYKTVKVYPLLIPYVKINANWIKDPNLRAKTIKFLEENVGASLYDFWIRQ